MLEIKLLTDCWGSESYFGYNNGKQFTEDYYSVTDLIENNPEFKDAVVRVKNNVWTLILKGEIQLINDEIIEQLKAHEEPIYFKDTTSEHWMFDFKINNVWFESVKIDMVKNIIEFSVFQ